MFVSKYLIFLICFGVLSFNSRSFAGQVPEYEGKVTAAFNDDCEHLLLESIKNARKSIYGAIYTFTKYSLAEALMAKADKKINIHLKIDKEQADFKYTKILIGKMRKAGIKISLIAMPDPEVRMHHKFAVIDEKTVLTGSFNWTRKASEENCENLIRIESAGLAVEFIKAWHKIK